MGYSQRILNPDDKVSGGFRVEINAETREKVKDCVKKKTQTSRFLLQSLESGKVADEQVVGDDRGCHLIAKSPKFGSHVYQYHS